MTITTENILLGKNIETPQTYNPDILVRVPRSANRDKYGITNKNMFGWDLWRCYECSILNENGIPEYFGIQITYPSNTKYIVESKSLKLYLNSFNMQKFESDLDARFFMISKVQQDLNALLETKIQVCDLSNQLFEEDYVVLDEYVNTNKILIEEYTENSSLLKTRNDSFKVNRFMYRGFRSNCKVTNAPDFANVYIDLKGPKTIDPVSLLKYLISFRNEAHLHEECCELIYTRLYDIYNPDYLEVFCAYTRRGGIDINPIRTNVQSTFDKKFLNRTIFQ